MLKLVLSSSLLVGVISAVAAFLNNKKNNNLKYITEDRRHWREEIRNVVDELENTKYVDRHKVLQKIKVRINPYGESTHRFLHDSHIWKCIYQIEKVSNGKEYREKKDELVFYLSLLLKYDWERTKKEVTGNRNIVALAIVMMFGLLYLIYEHFYVFNYKYNDLFLTAITTFLFLPIVLGLGAFQQIFKEIWSKKRHIVRCVLDRLLLIIFSVVYGGSILLGLPIYVLYSYRFDIMNIATEKGYIDATIVMAVVILLFLLSKNLTTKSIKIKYNEAVKQYIENRNINN